MPNDHGDKAHGDKLEDASTPTPHNQPDPGAPALPDDLASVDIDLQIEGSLKIHGDKLEPHSSSGE